MLGLSGGRLSKNRKRLTVGLNSDKITLSIGEADFLFRDNAPLQCVEEQTVFPIERSVRGFLLEAK